MGTRLRGHCGAVARAGPSCPARPSPPGWQHRLLAALRLPLLGLLRAQDQPGVGTVLGRTGPGLPAAAYGELWVLLGLWPWGTVGPRELGAPQHWHLGPRTFCCHRGPAGSLGMQQGSLAPVTFPFPSPASAKRVCYIFNILRALLVGI